MIVVDNACRPCKCGGRGVATRIKLVVHDGFGVWCAARRLNAGRFARVPATTTSPVSLSLTNAQFDALVLGLPWERLPELSTITRA